MAEIRSRPVMPTPIGGFPCILTRLDELMAEPRYLTTPPDLREMPPGIPYIVGNEAAERFSFYGMRTILVIFMVKYLQDSSGNDAPMSEEQANFWYHAFVMGAYFFPLLGALLSDIVWGKYRTIIGLSLLYCAGHLCLAIDETRPWLFSGLALIALGAGGIKPCVSAHVGDQFGARNQDLLPKVFGWFYFSINLGATVSSLLTPYLLKEFGPKVAFGVPGVLMFLATWVFWLGRNKFVHIPSGGVQAFREALSTEGLRAMRNLSVLYVFVAVFWALFDQTGSSWVQQARRMDLNWLGIHWLPSQVQAANPILVLAFIPLFSGVVYPAIHRVFPLTPLRKVGIGLFVAAVAFAVTVYIALQITGGEIVVVPSEADKEEWPAERLLDGELTGRGWISRARPKGAPFHEGETPPDDVEVEGPRPKPFFPMDIVVRLREQRAWNVHEVRVYGDARTRRELTESYLESHPEFDAVLADPLAAEDACRASDVEILVGDAPKPKEWKSVARMEIPQANETDSPAAPGVARFGPVETEYVCIRIHNNRGGEQVALSEIEVICDDQPPANAHASAASVWPNVAAIGPQPSISWQLLAYVLITAAEIMVSITFLEFSYTQAPRKMKSFVMSLYMLSVTAGNFLPLAVNYFIQKDDGTTRLEGPAYFGFFTALMFVAAVVFVFVSQFYHGRTYIQGTEDASPASA